MRAFTIVCVLMSSGLARGADYGETGTRELDGDMLASYQSATVSSGLQARTATKTSLLLQPNIGVFVAKGLKVSGGVAVGMDSTAMAGTVSQSHSLGLMAELGYYSRLEDSSIFLGGSLGLGYLSQTETTGESTATTASGIVVGLGISLKIPVGTGGVVSLGPALEYVSLTTGSGETMTGPMIGLGLGYGIYF